MLTWQGIGHITDDADSYDPEGVRACVRKIDKYLETGVLPVDGATCHNSKNIML